MVNVLLVTASTGHAAYTNSKASLEASGHTVTGVLDTTAALAAVSLTGIQVIATVRSSRVRNASWLAARWADGYPLLIGGTEDGGSTGSTVHVAADLGIVDAPLTRSTTTNGSREMANIANHPAVASQTPGSTVQFMGTNTFSVRDTGTPVGVVLGNNVGTDAPGEYAVAVAPGTALIAGRPNLPGGVAVAPARAVFNGWFYGNTVYNSAGDAMLNDMVTWLATPATPTLPANLTGSGAFSATVVEVEKVTASLTGSGAFSATVIEVEKAAANLSGSGVFSAAVVEVEAVGASLVGAGAFSADVVVIEVPDLEAHLTGSGDFSAVDTAVHSVTAELSGAGVFTATAVAVFEVSGTYDGTGDFEATATALYSVEAVLDGTGVFTAETFEIHTVAGTMDGSGAFDAIAIEFVQGSVEAFLTGSGDFSATSVERSFRDAELTGSGEFSATTVLIVPLAVHTRGAVRLVTKTQGRMITTVEAEGWIASRTGTKRMERLVKTLVDRPSASTIRPWRLSGGTRTVVGKTFPRPFIDE